MVGRGPGSQSHIGLQPLLLLPGTACDARVFEPVLNSVGAREVIRAELPRARDAAGMAAAVLRAAPPRFAIAGHSLGGIVALHVALAAPCRVSGLALIGANARAVPADRLRPRRREAEIAAVALDAHARNVLVPLYAGRNAASDPAFADLVATMAGRIGPAAFLDQTEAALSRPDLRARLTEITVPTAVIGGEEDRLGTPAMQRELAQGIVGAVLTMILATGHLAPIEAPAATAAALAAWLARVDAGTRGLYHIQGEERA